MLKTDLFGWYARENDLLIFRATDVYVLALVDTFGARECNTRIVYDALYVLDKTGPDIRQLTSVVECPVMAISGCKSALYRNVLECS